MRLPLMRSIAFKVLIQEHSTEAKIQKIRYQIPIENQGDLYFLNLEFFASTCQFRLQ